MILKIISFPRNVDISDDIDTKNKLFKIYLKKTSKPLNVHILRDTGKKNFSREKNILLLEKLKCSAIFAKKKRLFRRYNVIFF